MSEEVWRPYPEFNFMEGSNFGRVRTLNRVVLNGKGERIVKGHILPQYIDRYGYLQVNFGANGKKVSRKVHRIIASCFLPNPGSLEQVNHIDCNRANNNVSNLEWCSASYNMQYREKYGVSTTETKGHPVFAINLTTFEVSQFQSQGEAGRILRVNQQGISRVIADKCKTAGGYWFVNADHNAVENVRTKFGNKVAYEVEKLMNEKMN